MLCVEYGNKLKKSCTKLLLINEKLVVVSTHVAYIHHCLAAKVPGLFLLITLETVCGDMTPVLGLASELW